MHTWKFITKKSGGQERSRKVRNRKSIKRNRKFTVKKQGKGREMRKESWTHTMLFKKKVVVKN